MAIPPRPEAIVEVALVLNDGTSAAFQWTSADGVAQTTYQGLPVYLLTDPGPTYGGVSPVLGAAVATYDKLRRIWSINRFGYGSRVAEASDPSDLRFRRLLSENFARITDEGIDGLLEDQRTAYVTEFASADGQAFSSVRQRARTIDIPLILGGDSVAETASAMVARGGGSLPHPDQLRAGAMRSFQRRVRVGTRGVLVIRRWEPVWNAASGWVYTGTAAVSMLDVRVGELRLASDRSPAINKYAIPANLTLVADEDPFWTSGVSSTVLPAGGAASTTLNAWFGDDFVDFTGGSTEKTWRRFVVNKPATTPSTSCILQMKDAAGAVVYSISVLPTVWALIGSPAKVVIDTHPARRGAWVMSADESVVAPAIAHLVWNGTPVALADPTTFARTGTWNATVEHVYQAGALPTPRL